MALKQCKECGKDVGSKVNKCPHCGTDQRNWIGRHPILTTIIGLSLLGMIMNAINPNHQNNGSINSIVTSNNVTEAVTNVVDDDNQTIDKSEFNQIQNGMTYEQVVKIIGNAGELTSENEIAGFKSQMYMWKGHGGIGANANAMFQNGKLMSKAQFGLE